MCQALQFGCPLTVLCCWVKLLVEPSGPVGLLPVLYLWVQLEICSAAGWGCFPGSLARQVHRLCSIIGQGFGCVPSLGKLQAVFSNQAKLHSGLSCWLSQQAELCSLQLGDTVGWAPRVLRVTVQAAWFSGAGSMLRFGQSCWLRSLLRWTTGCALHGLVICGHAFWRCRTRGYAQQWSRSVDLLPCPGKPQGLLCSCQASVLLLPNGVRQGYAQQLGGRIIILKLS